MLQQAPSKACPFCAKLQKTLAHGGALIGPVDFSVQGALNSHMYDLNKAERVEKNGLLIGYLLQVNEDYWLPLDTQGNPCGPPSYKADATRILSGPDKT